VLSLSLSHALTSQGYIWGASTQDLLSLVSRNGESGNGFDTLILADVLFNHSEHEKLVNSILFTMKKSKESCALVFFTPYRPWLLEKDLAFFPLAESKGLNVEKVLEIKMDYALFEKDPGVSLTVATAHADRLSRTPS
jgi:EEF1A N-terminal glycine/lysine methyltransferase